MSSTPNLRLPYLDANQNQKTVTHNAALTALDALVNCQVGSAAIAVPPAAPADGQCWIVGAGGTGAWAGRDLTIAAWQDGAWTFYTPTKGMLAYNDASATLLAWTGAAWVPALGAVGQLQLSALGLGTAPDPSNPLSATLNAALFNALAPNAGGTGDVRVKLNKSAAGNTGSLLFQDGFSGRAEIGLAGDDNLHFRVSPDGTTFYDALDIAAAGGTVSFSISPAAPTPAVADSSAKLATTAYVQAQGFLTAAGAGSAAPVQSVAGRTGAVTLAAGDVAGTAPLNSPAFTGTPTAPNPATGTNSAQVATTSFVAASFVTYAYAAATYATLASPTLTGTPTAPTPPPKDNSTRLATTAYADRGDAAQLARTQVADAAYTVLPTDRTLAVIALTAARTIQLPAASAFPPGATLTVVDESGACSAANAVTIARAGSDTVSGAASAVVASAYGYVALESNGSNKWTVVDAPAPVTSVAGRIGPVALGVADVAGAAPLASPAFTGMPTAPNPAAGTNSAQVATTSFVAASFVTYGYASATYATAASPTLTGTPAAPTASPNSNSTQLATTAYADRAAAASNLARTQVNDAGYAVQPGDRVVAVIALTAPRILTLPASSAYPIGATLIVVDESGACSATNTLTLARAGADTVNGAASATVANPYGYLALQSNGAGKWTIVDQGAATWGNVKGGTVDGTVIGGTTPAAATFTALSTTGSATFGGATAGAVNVSAPKSGSPSLSFNTNGFSKWAVELFGTESGSNSGADLYFQGHDDSGAYLGNWLSITRATGTVSIPKSLTVGATGTFGAGASFAGSIASTLAPQSGWTLDASGSVQTLAAGATLVIVAGSGLVLLSNNNNGDQGLFLVGGGLAKLIMSTGGTFVASASPASGQIGLAYNVGSNSAYTIVSNYGSAVSLAAMLLRTRAA